MERKFSYLITAKVVAENSEEALRKMFKYVKSIDELSNVFNEESDVNSLLSESGVNEDEGEKHLFNFKIIVNIDAESSGDAVSKMIKYVKETDIEDLVSFNNLLNNQVEITLTDVKDLNDTKDKADVSIALSKNPDVDSSFSMNPPEADEDDIEEEFE